MAEPRSDHGAARRGANESPLKAVLVVLSVCLFASVLVTGSAVLLRPLIDANEMAARRAQLTGVLQGDAGSAGGRIETLVIDFATGLPDSTVDAETVDPATRETPLPDGVEIPGERDIAAIGHRPRHGIAYLLYRDEALELIVLPVYGQGFASMLQGYIGLTGNTEEVVGLTFYAHAETPGLGARIDSPLWLQQWQGKRVWGAAGEPALGVAEGPLDPASRDATHLVDALTGATWTGRGVTNLLRFWLGEDGYGPLLRNIRNGRVR